MIPGESTVLVPDLVPDLNPAALRRKLMLLFVDVQTLLPRVGLPAG